MKKCAWLLCLIPLLCVKTAFAASLPEIELQLKSGQFENGKYTLSYETVNNSTAAFSGTIAFGAFDGYGRMISLKSTEAQLDGSAKSTGKISLPGTQKDFCDIKTFVWDSLSSMQPQSFAASTDISDIPEPLSNESYYFFEEPFASLGEIPATVTVGGITFNRTEDGREVIVNKSGYTELGGSGNITKCSLGFKVKGDCTINVWARSRSSTEARVVKLGDASSVLAYFDAPSDRINKGTYSYTGGERELYIASKAAAVIVYAIEIIYEDTGDEINDEWSVSDYSSLKRAVWKANVNGGGTIIINAGTVSCKAPILLGNSGEGEITLCGGDGYEAILDFSEYRKTVDESATSSTSAITVEGSNCTIRNIVVENAPHTGVRINRSAGNNRIENVVSRYNGGSGFAMSNGVHDNTLKNCYSYRNCDIITKGENSDGFWVAFGAGTGNKLINCYSWENSDDGFDSFRMFNEVYYENCFAWRNGMADIFTGKFDFDRGRPLDENMYLVQKICEYDMSFKEKYNSGTFELPQGEFLLTTPIGETDLSYISASDFVGSEWRGNGNGIKMGSGETAEAPKVGKEAVRTLKNCITFEHPSKGFDRNNSDCTVYIVNGLSFDNYRNYWLDTCTIEQFDNAYSSITDKNLLPSGVEVKYLSNTELARAKDFLYERIDVLESMVKSDEIPDGICFERVFDILK